MSYNKHLPIETQRLTLRDIVASDLDDRYTLDSHPEVSRYQHWGPQPFDYVRRL